MNRWGARILGLLLLLVFAFLFVQMYRTLVRLQKQQGAIESSSRQLVDLTTCKMS